MYLNERPIKLSEHYWTPNRYVQRLSRESLIEAILSLLNGGEQLRSAGQIYKDVYDKNKNKAKQNHVHNIVDARM